MIVSHWLADEFIMLKNDLKILGGENEKHFDRMNCNLQYQIYKIKIQQVDENRIDIGHA
jgi:hypothetical protein